MCFSLEISRTNFIINLITCFLIFNKNKKDYKIIALFYFGVGLIQLFDYIFWLNQKKNKINYIFTKIAMIVTYLQPLLLAFWCYIYKDLDKFSYYISIIYLIIIIIKIISMYNYVDYTIVDKKTNILHWKWTDEKSNDNLYTFYLFIIIYLLYGNIIFNNNIEYPLNIISMIIFSITFIISLSIFKKNAGVLWCKISSFIPLIYLFLHP